MEKLAVIQSVYKNDKPEYLVESITSILNQSYSDFRYYIGVDGPIGAELKKALLAFKDDRIAIVWNKENKGLASILNRLLELCRDNGHEYIARMDSDDIAKLDRFEKEIVFLDENPAIDIVGGSINEIDEYGNNRNKITKYPGSPEECLSFFKKRNPVAHPTVIFRSRFFENIGWYYPTDFIRNEDTMLWYKALKANLKIANLPDVVLNFRMTDAMFTQRRNGKSFAKSQLEMRKIINKGLGYGPMSMVYAYAMYILMISPSWILKIAYKVLR